MAHFVAKFIAKEDEDKKPATWMIQTDGSSNQHAEGVGVILQSPEGYLIKCEVCLQFSTTNSKVKYEVVLTGLDLAKVAGALLAIIHND